MGDSFGSVASIHSSLDFARESFLPESRDDLTNCKVGQEGQQMVTEASKSQLTAAEHQMSRRAVKSEDPTEAQTDTNSASEPTSATASDHFWSPEVSHQSPEVHSSGPSTAFQSRRAITGSHHNLMPSGGTSLRPLLSSSSTSSLHKSSAFQSNWSQITSSPTTNSSAVNNWSVVGQSPVSPWTLASAQKRPNASSSGQVVPNSLKKSPPPQMTSSMISPSKFGRRSVPMVPMSKQNNMTAGSVTPFDLVSTGSDSSSSDSRDLVFQERQMGLGSASSPLDSLRLPLEQQLMEIIRTSGDSSADQYKGQCRVSSGHAPEALVSGFVNYNNHSGLQSLSQIQGPSFTSFDDFSNKKYFRGKSPFFTGLDNDNHILMDSNSVSDSGERFSRKVFVGGLPPDIDEEEITASFRRFGPLVVDWPHKAESKSYFPPKGYAFLLFQDESSVQALIDACIQEDDKLYLCVSSPTIKDKPVMRRPISDQIL